MRNLCLTRIIHLSIFVFGCAFTMMSQYRVDRYIPNTKIDSIWIANDSIRFSSNRQQFVFRGYKVSPVDHISPSTLLPSFYFQDSIVTSYIEYKQGFLLVINSRLYYFNGTSLRQFTLPIEGTFENISTLASCGVDFSIVANGKVCIWENDSYAYHPIQINEQIKFASKKCDNWGGYWVSDGESIFSILKEENIALPELNVKIIDHPYSSESNIILQEADELEFFVSASHTLWKQLVVQYQIEEISEQWITIENDSNIKVPFKSPGKFSVRFRASIDNNYYVYQDPFIISKSVANKSSWWWYLIAIPLVIFIAGWWISLREKKFQRSIIAEKEKYNLKADAMALQNKIDQLKMNPHFIFNVLTGLQGLIATGENHKARKVLTSFSSIMRYQLKENSKYRIPIEEEINFLRDYLSLEQISRNSEFDFEIKNEAEDSSTIPPMIIQPLVENSIIHGFKGIDYKGKISIQFSENDNYLVCIVEDNGVGRKSTMAVTEDSNHNSVALDIISKRLQSISKFKKGRLFFEDKGMNKGTIAIVEIPH